MHTIKITFSLFLALFSINVINSQVTYWENLSDDDRSRILSEPAVSRLAVDYHNANFQVSDDSLTHVLLAEISDKGDFNQFHFYIFNKILLNSEGKLADKMSHYCLKILLHFPEQLVNYFSDDTRVQSELYRRYVLMLAEELYFNERYMKYDIEDDRQEVDFTYKRLTQKLDNIFIENPVYAALKENIKERITEIKKNPQMN